MTHLSTGNCHDINLSQGNVYCINSVEALTKYAL